VRYVSLARWHPCFLSFIETPILAFTETQTSWGLHELVDFVARFLVKLSPDFKMSTEALASIEKVAPNLCRLLSADITLQLLTHVSGSQEAAASSLQQLAALPANELKGLGLQDAIKDNERNRGLYAGTLVFTPILSDFFSEQDDSAFSSEHRKAVQLIANKAKLVATTDLAGSTPDGSFGAKTLEEVRKKIEDLVKVKYYDREEKALPVPKDLREHLKDGNKRAGAKYQKQKEKYGPSALERLGDLRVMGLERRETAL